ncbi:hypothetical protein [Fluviispira sanaruensis]|uniref:Lipoprotein n=1 Tax=Fluviispira sanaruensis TaxID=2493639 RepID=A0A4P2VJ52_FLUSA|nr:hypothetical protein [Fluviispira sanaruensis]BBH53223.1 hypothetical protein JCM31447_16660 [Fluviispira sanaruensis]
MRIQFIFFSLLTFVSCISINNNNQQRIVNDQAIISKSGIITCFPEGTRTADHKIAHCEASAVSFYNNKLVFGNDKPLNPPFSPVFSIDYNSIGHTKKQKVTYHTQSHFTQPRKIEDITISFDEKYLFAITAFDYQKKEEFDTNGTLIYWRSNDFNKVNYMQIKATEGPTKDLRKYISDALGSPKYFKIEGLAIMPDNQFLIGVREQGNSYKDFNYTIKFISVSYGEKNAEIYLNDDFKIVYEFNDTKKFVNEEISLSSIEWDKFNNRLLLLTSFESKSGSIGAYLWTLNREDIIQGNAPQLVSHNSVPLKFNNKSEGLTIINKQNVFIINDDDRYVKPTQIDGFQYYKKANEAIYNIVQFKSSESQ